jgi:hypothetical protein
MDFFTKNYEISQKNGYFLKKLLFPPKKWIFSQNTVESLKKMRLRTELVARQKEYGNKCRGDGSSSPVERVSASKS